MASGMNVIKSYLVSLGFSLDDASYRKTMQSLDRFTKTVQGHTEGIAKAYVTAGGVIVSTLTAITSATATMVDKTAQADLTYQKFAMHMYMANNVAKQLKITTDALGESLDDIVWMPELRGRWQSLMAQSRQMETPKDAEGQLKFIRDIRFEFTRMRVEATYGMQWVTYYLVKYLDGPLKSMHEGLKRFNDWVQKNMPKWSEVIAHWLALFINMGVHVGKFFMGFIHLLERFWNALGAGGRGIVVFGAIVAAVFGTGPVGMALAVLSALVLLIDDYMGWMEGRKSSNILAPFWKTYAGVFQDIAKAAGNAVEGIAHLIDTILGGGGKIEGWLGTHKIIATVFKLVATAAEFTAGHVDQLGLMLQGKSTEEIGDAGRESIERIKGLWGIGNAESGGNYNAVNKDSGASGKYQIMPKNWGPWSREAGLPAGSSMTPANQEAVAHFKYNQYRKKYKDDRLVAAAWYAGEGTADALRSGGKVDIFKKQGTYPSIDEYIYKTTGKHWSTGSGFKSAFNNGFDNYNNITSGVPQSAYGGIQGGNSVHTEFGDVNVHVTHPNASPEQIYTATLQALQDATGAKTKRQLRDAGSVFQ